MTYDFHFQFPSTGQIQSAIQELYSQILPEELNSNDAEMYSDQIIQSFYGDFCYEQSHGNNDYILDWWWEMHYLVLSLWPDYMPSFPPVEPLPF